jgi:hypothetical protein
MPMKNLTLNVIIPLIFLSCGNKSTSQDKSELKAFESTHVSETVGNTASDSATQSGKVIPIAELHNPRAAHTATLLDDGTVLISGGFDGGSSNSLSSVEIFDPLSKTFTQISPLTTPRFDHSATLLPNGKVLIAGGYNGSSLATTEIYDPELRSFSQGPSMITARYGHTATPLNDGRILFVGGVGTGWTFLSSAEIFDIETNRFIAVKPMSEARESHTATLLKNGNVLIIGGHRDRRENLIVYTSTEIFDTKSNQFSAAGNLQIPRHKHDAVLLSNGNVLVIGGADRRDSLYSSAELYDPNTQLFTLLPDMNYPRFKHKNTSILLPDNNVLIGGGSNKAEVYNFNTGKFTTIEGDLGVTRYFSTSTLLNSGEVLITGGYDEHISGIKKSSLFVIREP